MKRLGPLLLSSGRTELLRTLMHQPGPVGLRQAARIAGIHPHAAELTLARLVREGRVRRRRTARRVLFELNRSHTDLPVLEAVFRAAEHGFIKSNSHLLQARAKQLLPFMREAARMLASARKSRHVS